MTARRLPLARIAFAAALACSAIACTSRTLPLPPPAIDSVSEPSAQGLTRVHGVAQEGAWIGVLNERTMAGVIVTSAETGCGRQCPFEARLAAESGDHLRIWQFFNTSTPSDSQVP